MTIMEKLASSGKNTSVEVNVTNNVSVDEKLDEKVEVVASTEENVKASGSGADVEEFKFKTIIEALSYDFADTQTDVTGIVVANIRRILKETRKKYSSKKVAIAPIYEDGAELVTEAANQLADIKNALRSMKKVNKELGTELYNIEYEAIRLVSTDKVLMSMLKAEDLGI